MIKQGNPFYPIAMFGLPGLELTSIVPIHQVFVKNPWTWLFYPWSEFPCESPFDDNIGAVAAGIAIPALLLWPLLRDKKKDMLKIGSGVIFSITILSLIMFLCSSGKVIRIGMFLVLICFVLVGELWRAAPSRWLKVVTFAAYLIMTTAITHRLAGGYLYEYFWVKQTRSERLDVPAAVDSVLPTRIFNAAPAPHTYGLMGRDYRHEVVTLFGK